MKSGIYRLDWDNGHFYYGQSQNLAHRKRGHMASMKKGYHTNAIMNRLYKLCGLPAFTIVEHCEIELLNEREQHYLDLHHSNRWCCNIEKIAGSARGMKRSEVTKAKLRAHRLGKKLPLEQVKKIGDAVRKRYAEGWKVKPRYGMDNPYYGKKHSEEIRIKMRKSKNCGDKNSRARLVINLETGIFYGSVKNAAESIPMKHMNLYYRLTGHTKNKTSFVFV